MDISTSEVPWNEWLTGYFETQNRQSKWVIAKIVNLKELWFASPKRKPQLGLGLSVLLLCIQYSGWDGTHRTGVWPLIDAGFGDFGA
jgi:hypothetical protein